jgi:hypothetical protein
LRLRSQRAGQHIEGDVRGREWAIVRKDFLKLPHYRVLRFANATNLDVLDHFILVDLSQPFDGRLLEDIGED